MMQLARRVLREHCIAGSQRQRGGQTARDLLRETGSRQHAAWQRRIQFGRGDLVRQLRRVGVQALAQPDERRLVAGCRKLFKRRAQTCRRGGNQDQIAASERGGEIRGYGHRVRNARPRQISKIDARRCDVARLRGITRPQCDLVSRREADADCSAPRTGAKHCKLHTPHTTLSLM